MNNDLSKYTELLKGSVNVDYFTGSIYLTNNECELIINPLIGSNNYLIIDSIEGRQLLADRDTTLELFKVIGINPERFYKEWAKSNFQNAD